MEIRSYHRGWGVFTPDWCEGKIPVFGSSDTNIFECIAWKARAERTA